MYNLRARVGTGVATQDERALDVYPRSDSTDTPSSMDAPRITGLDPHAEATVAVRSYSQVVASRPPSPADVRPLSPAQARPALLVDDPLRDQSGTTSTYRRDDPVNSNDNVISAPGYTQSENGEYPEREDNSPWTTVRRRRARSHDTPQRKKPLTAEQQQIVKIAADKMTDEQRKAVRRRQQNIQIRRGCSPINQGKVSTRQKGKTIDPREWGNVNISRESLDLEAQAIALDSFKLRYPTNGHLEEETPRPRNRSPEVNQDPARRHARHSETTRKRRHNRPVSRPVEIQPAPQIAPKSFLGTALRNIERPVGSRHLPSTSSSSPSSSNSSDDESTPSLSDGEEVESDPEPRRQKRRRDNRHGRNRRRPRSASSLLSGATRIKPIPLKEYDGTADARAYHRFVRESDIRKSGEIRYSNMSFMNPSQYYIT